MWLTSLIWLPFQMWQKPYLPILPVQFANLVWLPLWIFHKPCLATLVFTYNSCFSGTITTLLQSPSPTYMLWKGTIGLNCEWSPVGSSVVLQSSISWWGCGPLGTCRFGCVVFLYWTCVVFGSSSLESEVSLSSFVACHSPLHPPVMIHCVNRSPVTRWF